MPPASFAGHVLPSRERPAPAAKPAPKPAPAAKPAEKRQTADPKPVSPRETAARPLKRTALLSQDRPAACGWCGTRLAPSSPAFVCSWGCFKAMSAYGDLDNLLSCSIDVDQRRRLLDLVAIEAKHGGSIFDWPP